MGRDLAKKSAYNKAYAQAHREELLQAKREHYAAHRLEILAKIAAKRKANLEIFKARELAYDARNRAKRNQKAKERHQANPESAAQYRQSHRTQIAQYRQSRSEEIQAARKRYVARKRNAPVADFTAAQWREMQAHYNHRCVYCGKYAKGKLTKDHITPLSKGGSHTKTNIVPACRTCNCRKQDGPPLQPVQPLLL